MHFTARDREFALLDDLYHRSGAQFLLLQGGHRCGKTALLTHWLDRRNHLHLYWLAAPTSATNQLRHFSQTLFQFLNPQAPLTPTFSYPSWEAAFAEAARRAANERIVLVLDEFSHVLEADPEAAGRLRRAWDQFLQNSGVMLVLISSLAGTMQRLVLDYDAPLYGRPTSRLTLPPLPFGALPDLLPAYDSEQHVAVHAISGGVPAYIELFSGTNSVPEALQQRIVSPTNVLLNDALFLLHRQLDEPRNYVAVLAAIAGGAHRLTEIATISGIDRSNISKYLGVLRELGFVERDVPATVPDPDRFRKGRYRITAPYLRFYFALLAPLQPLIARGQTAAAAERVQQGLERLIAEDTFPDLCREWVDRRAAGGHLPFVPERNGRFWAKNLQIDLLAINREARRLLCGACVWGTRRVSWELIPALLEKSAAVLPAEEGWQADHAIFARHRFTSAAQALAAMHDVQLVTLPQLAADLRSAD